MITKKQLKEKIAKLEQEKREEEKATEEELLNYIKILEGLKIENKEVKENLESLVEPKKEIKEELKVEGIK